MNFKTIICAILLIPFTPLGAQIGAPAIQFGQFPANVYRGHIKIPREFHKDSDGLWVDESGHPSFPPHINFAGEYFLAAHTCGTCCRYYTLNNLRTGGEVKNVSMFDAGDPTPLTKDGRTYVPILFYKPDSSLLVVQYELDLCTTTVQKKQCRQRYFVFKDDRFTAISRTFQSCTHEGDEPE